MAHTWFRGKRAVIDIQNLLHRGKAQNPRLLAQLEHEPNLVDLNDVKRLQSKMRECSLMGCKDAHIYFYSWSERMPIDGQ